MNREKEIVCVDTPSGEVRVERLSDEPRYAVFYRGDLRHNRCTAEDVMRALAMYLMAVRSA
jgi:hypothetical protein